MVWTDKYAWMCRNILCWWQIFMNMFYSLIRTTWNSTIIQTFPPRLEKKQSWKWTSDNFLGIIHMSAFLEKIQFHAWLYFNPWGKVLFLLKIMGQICPLDWILLRTFSPGLESNNKYKWISDNFPGMLTYVLFLESCQKYICMHCFSPILEQRY